MESVVSLAPICVVDDPALDLSAWRACVRAAVGGGAGMICVALDRRRRDAALHRVDVCRAEIASRDVRLLAEDDFGLALDEELDGVRLRGPRSRVRLARQVIGPERILALALPGGTRLEDLTLAEVDVITSSAFPPSRTDVPIYIDGVADGEAARRARESGASGLVIRAPGLLGAGASAFLRDLGGIWRRR
jgi:thiamine monophosphate synthase